VTTSWTDFVDGIRKAFETGTAFTVFGGPRPIARLPNALGGDPAQWATLQSNADKGTESQLALLHAKAHFLLLPKSVIVFLTGGAENHRVEISNATVPNDRAAVNEHDVPWRSAEMLLPGASEYLVRVGYDLARVSTTTPVGYDTMGVIYHEMTHALLWLQEFADADVQKLANDGYVAYLSASSVNGPLDPRVAFSEAAAYYVEARITRWCQALDALNRLIRTPPPAGSDRTSALQAIISAYDNFVPTPASVKGEVIASPDLSQALRDALDKKVLDGRSLTKSFADTELDGLRAAIEAL
jgi:hypothetical protein